VTLDRSTEVGKFDRYAQSYSQAHAASVRASGEAPEFFAQHKLECLWRQGATPTQSVLDYGCGTGSLTQLLAGRFAAVAGYDPSALSLQQARAAAPTATFYEQDSAVPERAFDLAILSGVLHHVPPAERAQVLHGVAGKLRPGGRLFVFEHNPYNPLTVQAVRACPFDDDAVLLPPAEVRALLREAGLQAVEQQFVLFFPRLLQRLRPFEPWLRWCPLGAQTLTLGSRVGTRE
jgi:SAM-dependent methyltransferase